MCTCLILVLYTQLVQHMAKHTLKSLNKLSTMTPEQFAYYCSFKSVPFSDKQIADAVQLERNGNTERWQLNEQAGTWQLVSLH